MRSSTHGRWRLLRSSCVTRQWYCAQAAADAQVKLARRDRRAAEDRRVAVASFTHGQRRALSEAAAETFAEHFGDVLGDDDGGGVGRQRLEDARDGLGAPVDAPMAMTRSDFALVQQRRGDLR